MPRILVFDVNETLLDLRALEFDFERIFGDARITHECFGLVLRNSVDRRPRLGYQRGIASRMQGRVCRSPRHGDGSISRSA